MSSSRWRGLSAGLLVLAGLFLLAGSTAPIFHAESPRRQTLTLQSRVQTGRIVPEEPSPSPPLPVPAPGALGRLLIPAIRVDATMLAVGITPQGAIDVTKGIWDVGWYDQSVKPGESGSAFIEGHLDWYTGPAVFWDLHRLQMGDEVDLVHQDGTTSRFRVSLVRQLGFSAAVPADMLATDGPSRLNLVTCAGTWLNGAHTYSNRLAVTATLFS